MLPFEKTIIDLFKTEGVEYKFDSKHHILNSGKINIEFIPYCSLPEYQPSSADDLPPNTIRVWEDQVVNSQAVIESRILSFLGISKRIHARETEVKEISQQVFIEFVVINHMNIPTSGKYRYGLFKNDELVAVAAFGRSCPIDQDGKRYKSHELIRFGNILNHTVVGGLSKLIRHFEQAVKPEHIMTYVDREWSEGKSLLKLGFKKVGITPAQTFYIDPDICIRRYRSEFPGDIDEDRENDGWQVIKNLGSIKLVKILV
ncbi:MAG: hypothetical protein ABFS32_13720 [Bacteroidota bacterium]